MYCLVPKLKLIWNVITARLLYIHPALTPSQSELYILSGLHAITIIIRTIMIKMKLLHLISSLSSCKQGLNNRIGSDFSFDFVALHYIFSMLHFFLVQMFWSDLFKLFQVYQIHYRTITTNHHFVFFVRNMSKFSQSNLNPASVNLNKVTYRTRDYKIWLWIEVTTKYVIAVSF